MPIKDTFPKNVKKLIRTNSLYIEYTFLDQIFKNSGKKVDFFDFKENTAKFSSILGLTVTLELITKT